jgi:hypothetical protein
LRRLPIAVWRWRVFVLLPGERRGTDLPRLGVWAVDTV